MQELIGFKSDCVNEDSCYYVYVPTKFCAFMTIPASMGVLIILLGATVTFHSYIAKKDKIKLSVPEAAEPLVEQT